jgi:hypothetical protein
MSIREHRLFFSLKNVHYSEYNKEGKQKLSDQ